MSGVVESDQVRTDLRCCGKTKPHAQRPTQVAGASSVEPSTLNQLLTLNPQPSTLNYPKRLVLRRGGHAVPNRQLGEEAADLLGSELSRGSAANKSLKFPHPETVSSQGFAGVVPELDSSY
jgi:hypothetical protein